MAGEIHTIQSVAEVVPLHFQDRVYLLGAAAVVLAGGAIEYLETRRQNRMSNEAAQIADPGNATSLVAGARTTRIFERSAMLLAGAFGALGLAQVAGPYNSNVSVKGQEGIVINGGYSADANDMTDGATRLADSITGTVRADLSRPEPFSIILDGDGAGSLKIAPTIKDEATIRGAIDSQLNNAGFRNGDLMADSAQAGVSAVAGTGGNVIFVTTGLPYGDLQTSASTEQAALQSVIASLPSNTKASAIIVGQGGGSATVGDINLSISPDVTGYQAILGIKNVYTANSANQIQQYITKISANTVVQQTRSNNYLPFKGMIASGAAAAGLVYLRRSRRLFKRDKSKPNEGSK
ncbi:MAG TPA: hypothetical protein VIH90_03860 [Candidatus Saccharimonadales bacterium]